MPLHIACGNGHVDAARLLLDKGAEVDRANQNGTTPLYVACQNGHADAASAVAGQRRDVDQSRNGVTLLFLACQNGHVDVAQLLLERRRGGRPGAGEWHDAARRLPARPRRRGAAVVRKGRGGRSGDELGCDAAVHRKITGATRRRRCSRSPDHYHRKAALLRQQSDVQCSICLGPCVERAWTKCNHSFCRKASRACRTNHRRIEPRVRFAGSPCLGESRDDQRAGCAHELTRRGEIQYTLCNTPPVVLGMPIRRASSSVTSRRTAFVWPFLNLYCTA